MRQLVYISFLTAAMLSAARAADQPPKLDPILKGIEDRYNKAKTVQVDFVQTYTDRARKTTEKGTLFLQRPGKPRNRPLAARAPKLRPKTPSWRYPEHSAEADSA